jgi:predicted methyltransferase
LIKKTSRRLRSCCRFSARARSSNTSRTSRTDEARHVAFGVEHAKHYLAADPDRAKELRDAVANRAEYLTAASAGANPYVEDALVVLAAGGLSPAALPDGVRAFRQLQQDMHERRVRRLRALGFDQKDAEDISDMHTPNFM